MNAHLRANLWLLSLTVLLCCVLYPLTLWAIGQGLFPDKASGSLLDKNGNPTRDEKNAIGSRLIGQPFKGPEYFQPRPSAPGYDASASGGSNLSANNPKLRARVAQTLGPIVKYKNGPKKGQLVGTDIEEWLRKHPGEELVEVPADMVMASGSGLDPHITLKNARYQLDRVAAAWADKTKMDLVKVRKAIENLLNQKAEAPFGGLAGVEIINVLEVNLALPDVMKGLRRRVAGNGDLASGGGGGR
jgi:K+-transporting ATPase c subunit